MIFPSDANLKEEIYVPTNIPNSTEYTDFKYKSLNVFGNLSLSKDSPLKTETVDSYDYWRDPNKWTKYSLEEVPMDDIMAFSQAATETRRIIELDSLRTKLREMSKKQADGISTLLDEEDEVFSLQTLKEHLPQVGEVGVPQLHQKNDNKKEENTQSISNSLAKLKLEHLTYDDNGTLNASEYSNQPITSFRSTSIRKRKNFYSRTSTLE